MDLAALGARLSKQLARPVQRSGGSSIGKLEELALTAQEARLFAAVDGTRRGEGLVQQHAAAMPMRILYLLSELKHLSFSEVEEAPAAAAPPRSAATAPAPAASVSPVAANARRAAPAVVVPVPPAAPGAARMTPKVVIPVPPAAAGAPRSTPLRGTTPVPGSTGKTPVPARPPVPVRTFAMGPAGETPEAQLARLRGLLARLEKGTHFDALGLDRKSTPTEVKKAFVLLARDLHPDTVTDPAQTELRDLKERLFARVNEAAQVLGDEARRKQYEAELGGDKKDVDIARIFDAEEKFRRAEILIKARKYKEGLALLDDAIQLNDKEAEFYAWRGYARLLLATDRKQAFDDCTGEVKRALKLVERCLPAHLFLGHMQQVVGNIKAASSSYQRVLDLEPTHIEAQRELRLMGKKT